MPDESLERLRTGRKKIEDLTAQISGSMDAERRRIEEASRVRIDQQRAKLKEEWDHFPKPIGEQRDLEFRPDGRIVPESIRRVIEKWDDGYGNIIFTDGSVNIKGIHELSRQIGVQKNAFGVLSDEEKSRIQAEFNESKDQAKVSKPYSSYLRSETLGRKFQELEQNPPMPFARKL